MFDNSFINNRKFKLFLFPSNSSDFFQGKINANNFNGEVYEIECYIDYERLEKTNKTLCIDFGTSNTTAGSYKIKNYKPNNTVSTIGSKTILKNIEGGYYGKNY